MYHLHKSMNSSQCVCIDGIQTVTVLRYLRELRYPNITKFVSRVTFRKTHWVPYQSYSCFILNAGIGYRIVEKDKLDCDTKVIPSHYGLWRPICSAYEFRVAPDTFLCTIDDRVAAWPSAPGWHPHSHQVPLTRHRCCTQSFNSSKKHEREPETLKMSNVYKNYLWNGTRDTSGTS